MLVAVTGASGLIGTALTRRLRAEGHEVLRLTRSAPTGPGQVQWDPAAGRLDPDALAKADAVVHLAGHNIGRELRWTARIKRDIVQSRVEGTALVARTMAELAEGSGGPRVLVCASGAHYYGDRGDEVLTEASSGGRAAGGPPAYRAGAGRRRGGPAQAGSDVPDGDRRPVRLRQAMAELGLAR